MTFLVKVTMMCPEGSVEKVKYITCNGEKELEKIMGLSVAYRSYSFFGVVEPLDKYEERECAKMLQDSN